MILLKPLIVPGKECNSKLYIIRDVLETVNLVSSAIYKTKFIKQTNQNSETHRLITINFIKLKFAFIFTMVTPSNLMMSDVSVYIY